MASAVSWPAFPVSPEEAAKSKWYIATAATNHMSRDRSLISNFKFLSGLIIADGNGAGLQMRGHGAVNTETIVIPDVWYVPGINVNLVSVSQIAKLGHRIEIGGGVCTITRVSDGSVVGKAKAHTPGGVYEVEFLRIPLN